MNETLQIKKSINSDGYILFFVPICVLCVPYFCFFQQFGIVGALVIFVSILFVSFQFEFEAVSFVFFPNNVYFVIVCYGRPHPHTQDYYIRVLTVIDCMSVCIEFVCYFFLYYYCCLCVRRAI